MKKKSINYLVQAGVIAAMYAALTYVAVALGWGYMGVQFRFSEALTVLAAFTPAAIPGLTIGCFIGNLGSPFGMVDIVLGTFASFIAAWLGWATRNVTIKGFPALTVLYPVITNAVIVGAEVAYFLPEGFSWLGYGASALSVGLGEAAVCLLLGVPLLLALKKSNAAQKLFKL